MSAAADVIILDSSPEQPPSHTPARPAYDPEKLFGISPPGSSPPSVVSPSELFRPPSRSRFFSTDNQSNKRPNTRGKNAPNEKPTSSESPDVGGTEPTTVNKPKRGRGKAASKAQDSPATSASDQNKKESAPKRPRVTKTKSTEGPKKRGRPSTKAPTDNKTLSGRVAKAGNVQPKESDAKTKCPSTPKSPSGETAENPIDWEKEGLQLEAATKRRMDWTPTKDTMKRAVETGKVEGVGDSISNKFSSLLADYNFSGGSSIPQLNSVIPEDGFITKRRRIELVDSVCNPESRQRSPDNEKPSTEEKQSSKAPGHKKRKQPKPKKLTTLTARVTAQYNHDLADSSGLLGASGKDSTPVQTKSTKSKGKGKSKPQEPEFIVLSPEAAAKSLDDQDLVFGTCSQLQREDSPTLLRETQAAILESEKSITAASTSSLAPDSQLGPSSTSTVSRFKAPRNLWSVAARDSEGSLAHVDVIDLSDSPAFPKISSISNKKPKAVSKDKQSINSNVSDDFSSHHGASEPKNTAPLDKELPPVANQDTNTHKSKTKETTHQPAESLQKPQYTGFTDAELSKQVASYGFKAVRNRKKMIELLEKCWDSQHGTCQSLNDETKWDNRPSEPPTAPSQPQTKGKGTRKATGASQATTTKAKVQTSKSSKSTTKSKTDASTSLSKATKKATSRSEPTQPTSSMRSFADIEEIQDSEDEATPSPSRLLSRFSRHITEDRQTLPMSPTPSAPPRNTTKHLPASQAPKSIAPPDLASQITKAVRAQSQSHASSRPPNHLTWHEKMLLYDPIILEDFTGWLNTEGLALVSEDREVGAGFVRQWCENRSICCCYR
ncbi:hypothetical protein P170DRAFT_414022 [Aspergillus steynii IBT 23096]|uniref:Structure-specific endonuclease subunit SLX4 n=1 Tax=Aspergillus steynii IBT 23096 TaxID=1392250 RepID=A0A2I2FYB8_9EURO|nr:uncharacterized protein P170DRAFT_414022 [Aspergillus steynii IBT 23096]PLB45631.1 hypothetical protein P170DRAFT_414022 [Aspergillus steynii IBT 23096]